MSRPNQRNQVSTILNKFVSIQNFRRKLCTSSTLSTRVSQKRNRTGRPINMIQTVAPKFQLQRQVNLYLHCLQSSNPQINLKYRLNKTTSPKLYLILHVTTWRPMRSQILYKPRYLQIKKPARQVCNPCNFSQIKNQEQTVNKAH